MIGKWHLGTTPGFSPTYRGFDEWFGLPYSDDMGCTDRVWPNLPLEPTCDKDPPATRASTPVEAPPPEELGDGGHKGWPLPLYRSTTNCSGQTSGDCNKDIVEQPARLETLSQRYAAYAHDVVGRSVQSRRPFFLYVAFAHMHVPQFCAAGYANKTGRGAFADALSELDDTVGSILGSLEAHGVRRETLVLMTGDNGPWQVKCELTGSAGPFLGAWQQAHGGGSSAKTTLWEAGHREVGLASWPGTIAAGAVSAALASTLDYLPTVAAAVGARLPADRVFDGISLLPLLLGQTGAHGHAALFHPNSGASGPDGALDAVRHGKFKGVWQTGGAPGCGKGNEAPPRRFQPPLLFDLEADPQESTPLDAATHASVLEAIEQLRAARLADINGTFRSVANYSMGEAFQPCCNAVHIGCRCTDDDSESGSDSESMGVSVEEEVRDFKSMSSLRVRGRQKSQKKPSPLV